MQKRLNRKKRTSRGIWMIILLLLLIFLLLFLWYFNPDHKISADNSVQDSIIAPQEIADSILSASDTSSSKDSAFKDTIADLIETLPKVKIIKAEVKPVKSDTAIQQNRSIEDTVKADSVRDSSDSIVTASDPCIEDTMALWIFPDPSGGLHRKAITVSLIANKNCQIRYRLSGEEDWTDYQEGVPVTISSTSTLQFDGTDSCGKQMEMREEYYEIEMLNAESPCLSGMELVSVGSSRFCIDRYEWPNQKGAIPKSYISLYQAMDSCYSVGKRLCTSEEWMLACNGPHTSNYPYGQVYERYACATHDKKVPVSGSRPECRSFYGVYDMSGSLLEWTNTKAQNNRQFYYVMGGFWESGPQSGCSDKRYSYFPENQHNPVGFRCCSEIPEPTNNDDKKKQNGSGRKIE